MMKKAVLLLTVMSISLLAQSYVKKIELKAEGSSSGKMLDRITCDDNSTILVYKLNKQWHDNKLNVWGDANETIEELAEYLCEPPQ